MTDNIIFEKALARHVTLGTKGGRIVSGRLIAKGNRWTHVETPGGPVYVLTEEIASVGIAEGVIL